MSYSFFRQEAKSFSHAWRGLRLLLRHDRHGRFHFIAAVAVIGMAIWCDCTLTEWLILLLCIGMVISAELLNTAIEQLCDVVEPSHDERIGRVKDLAAAAVLIASCGSLVIAGIIFLPKLGI